MREPSASRSWRLVVGLDSSTPAHSPADASDAAAAAAAEDVLAAPTSSAVSVRPLPVKAVYFGFSGSLYFSSFLTRLTVICSESVHVGLGV